MLKDVAPGAASGTTQLARRLRREMSLPEVVLWQALRTRPNGLKFRRQRPSDVYVLDFYCADARLAIEVDGEVHGRGDRLARDAWFQTAGITIVRVPAREVLRDRDVVMRGVLAACMDRLPLHHPAMRGGPPPRDELGED